MKRILILIIVIITSSLLFSCNCNNGSCEPQRYQADTYNFSGYVGKTISDITYSNYDAQSGYHFTVLFTDNTYLKVYAYKYTMKIGNSDGYDADKFDFSSYKGLGVQSIYYGNNEGNSGDILTITLYDARDLKIYAYKYTMEICK